MHRMCYFYMCITSARVSTCYHIRHFALCFSRIQKAPSSRAGALTRGKVTREVLDDVFGPSLLAAVQAAERREKELSASTKRQRARRRNSGVAQGAAGAEGADAGKERDEDTKEQEKGEDEDEDEDADADEGEGEDEEEDDLVDQLAGSETLPGKLQVW